MIKSEEEIDYIRYADGINHRALSRMFADIKEGDTPQTVAENLAAAFNSCNAPNFIATATGAEVVFTASELQYKVSDMRFIINSQTENVPASGAIVAVGNTGLSVKNANG